ncbi:prolyl oligopeptidase family serine peptidase [Alkalimonas collagenimarina]|uniref:Prolyl oligopeptidase family serine peptidase n=1 Tax=Alkalimonas collagenimarina TaxID=400390 RepID=A0ABT9GW74_9GAMM|nr:prolyl oligopeptidase family serine peptidase [Alkalimonas collagenimarina]MDP4535305.1 prolyl oligopeptidase family serine peptidase [Alkalimonas collagenimarina]
MKTWLIKNNKHLRQSRGLALCLVVAMGTFACSQLPTAETPAPTAVVIPSSSTAIDALRPLTLSDVMQFREIKERSISQNQRVMVYTAEPDYGDSSGYVVHLMTGQQFSVAYADRGQLNKDGSFALFRQRASLLQREQASDKEARDALPHDAVLLNTENGEQTLYSNIERFAFTGDGRFAVLLQRKADSKDTTQLLQAVELASGRQFELGQVTEFSVADEGSLVAFVEEVSDTDDDSLRLQQVQLWDAAFERQFELTPPSESVFQHLRFSSDGKQLVFLNGKRADKENGNNATTNIAQQLWHWPAELNKAEPLELAMDGWILSHQQTPRWSDDGLRVFLGFRPEPHKTEEPLAAPETEADLFATERLLADRRLQVWHGQDERINPQQKAEYQQAQKRTAPAVLWLENEQLVALSDDIEDRLYFSEHSEAVLISNGRPYLQDMTWDGRFHDVWHVNLRTGERQQVFARNRSVERAHLSPSGRYAVYQQGGQWQLFDSENGSHRVIGADANVSWLDETHDRPEPAASYGVADWLADESAVLVYDRFDIWQLQLDGSSRNLTQAGRDEQQRYRLERTDPKALAIEPGTGLLLSAFNEEDKSYGFYQLSLKEPGVQPLVADTKRFDMVEALPELGGYLYTEQSFRQFPDIWWANADFTERRQLTDVNPQQADFIWGDSHLIDWYTGDGERLQGVVITPDGYDASKPYPVLVYYYEQFSQRLHHFNQMKVNHRPNFPFYLGQDYVVFLPDVRFREGAPGPSATESLLPGIDRLIELGIADPGAIGLHGHSWSGYQTAFVVTETDRFAAAVAGAPVSNMTSAYSGIRWQTGLARLFQYETGQSRLGVSMYEDLKPYLKNSPVFFAERINTPMLIQFGDADGAVPWEQGIEYYLALRRLGKDVVMLHYEDEPHHLQRYANKLDYTIKMLEFFNHYLKGEPAPDWWVEGMPYQKYD